MIIHSVRLENIRSYTNEKIEFPEGSTLLSGDIGSGKSTILLAIEFALFGLKKGSGNSLLRHGSKEGSVELRFSTDNKDIMIKRTLKRSKEDTRQESGYMIIDNVKTDMTPVEIKSKVIELLGYPKESLSKKDLIYTYTVYTPQEEMKQILSEDTDTRLEILRKVFGIDKYKRIRDNCGIMLKELKEKKANLEGKAEGIEQKRKEKEELEKEDRDIRENIEKTKTSLEKARKDMFESKNRLRESENKMYRLNNIKKELELSERSAKEKEEHLRKIKEETRQTEMLIAELKKRASQIQLAPAPIKSEEEIEKDIQEKEEKANETTRKKELARQKIENTITQAKDITIRLEEAAKKTQEKKRKIEEKEKLKEEIELISKIETDIERSRILLQDITGKMNESKIHMTASKDTIEKITKIDSCPTCLQKVSETHKRNIIDKENNRMKENRIQLTSLEEIRKEKEELLKRQKIKHSELLKKQNTLERLDAEIKMAEKEEKNAETDMKKMETLKQEKENLEKILEQLNSTDTEQLKKAAANFRKMLETIRNNKIKEKEKIHLENTAEDKKEHAEKLKIQETSITKEIEDKKNLTEELKENIKELGDIEKEHEKAKENYDLKASEEKKIEVEKAKLDTQLFSANKRIKSLEEEIKSKEEAKEKTKKIAELQNWTENYFITLMGIIEKQVMGNIYWQFNELFQQWFNQLIEDETISARIDDQFTPAIQQNGYDTKIEFLSGGERTSAALAYRLALNKVINKLVSHIKTKDLIILDEPTDGFSSEQLDKVRTVLDQLDVKQLIVVSHESKIESFVNNVIRINKNEHESRVVV